MGSKIACGRAGEGSAIHRMHPAAVDEKGAHAAERNAHRFRRIVAPGGAEAGEKLLDTAIGTVQQADTLNELSTNIAKLAFKDSANIIAREVYKLAIKYRKEHGR